ncbi:MAG: membrane protein insertase YidC [Halofilum sp. (in: g-proteobacteria)]|nr:membrane protein insertase YidC [Halofilum sp. (in: g-proteobacteria)]
MPGSRPGSPRRSAARPTRGDAPAGDVPDAPVASQPSGAAGDDTAAPAYAPDSAPSGAPSGGPVLASGERIHVVTDLLDVTVDTRGGDLRRALLRQYRAESGSERPVTLLSDEPGRLFVAQSGLQAGDAPAPSHHSTFSAERSEYRLAEGQDTVEVPLTWSDGDITVTKTYTFHRNSYVVDVAFTVANAGGEPWTGRAYRQLQREPVPDSEMPTLLPAFFGAAYYTPADKYETLDLEDIAEEPMRREVEGGWSAMVEHYFLAAWITGAEARNTLYTKALDEGSAAPRYIIGSYEPGRQVAAGGETRFETRIYLGPKENDHLQGAAKGLELTIDYGYMTFLSAPLFWVLDYIHSYVGNWGWAIILLTLLIKLVFYKLSETSYRSMARMKKLQPKIQQLKERYGDDREKMGRAMMDLYKKEKINPLGGCLPILVQIPVFIALYWMLLGSVELRHADFMLWIDDLSVRDPFYVLPVLMGASMWAQQKLNPAPVDPIQQKVFMALPFVFTVFFAFFPAGLVLYWLTNNVLSIAQQYYITRHVVGEAGTRQRQEGQARRRRPGGNRPGRGFGAGDRVRAQGRLRAPG